MSKKAEGKDPFPFDLIDSQFPSLRSRKSPMTEEELEILVEMRGIKAQARAVKSRLAGILPGWKQYVPNPRKRTVPDEAKTDLQLLNELRIKWKERAQAYKEARHRRMLALGHEDT